MVEESKENLVKLDDLNSYSRGINTIVEVLERTPVREVTSRRDNHQHRVCDALVGDDTASIYLTLWNDDIDKIEAGMVLRIKNGYINVFRASMRLNIGRYGSYKILEEAPFEEVNRDKNLSSDMIEDGRRKTYRKYR
ncbi:MAG: hypothetical protein ACLFVP_09430 [Candidatus Bathyarchaeia archaeon]